MNARWTELHQESERLAGQAQVCSKSDPERAVELYGKAAEAEERALGAIAPGKPRTLGVTAVSAAALWYKAGELARARRVAEEFLSHPDLPRFAFSELREILADIESESSLGSVSAGEEDFEVEITFQQTVRFSISAPSTGVAKQRALERWKAGGDSRIVASEPTDIRVRSA